MVVDRSYYQRRNLLPAPKMKSKMILQFSNTYAAAKRKVQLAAGLLLAGSLFALQAGQVSIHDPCMAKEGDTYYIFSTDPGIKCYSSTDMVHWKFRTRVFPGEPFWARGVTSKFNGHIWAPDISLYDGKYYLYYAVSSPGKNSSAIGVTINKTLDPDSARLQMGGSGHCAKIHTGPRPLECD